ncbi:MAG: hypothetical protein ACLFUQ_01765 [Candidatus Izemoplasmataceae bacterium]
MKETFSNGWRSFRLLADFHDYTNKERILKSVLLPFLFALNVLLFVLIAVLYLIERLFAIVFRFFITLQSKVYRKRMFVKESFRVYFTLMSVLIFILFLPFIFIYYASMGLKYLGKKLMRRLIEVMDFSNRFKRTDLYVFDDTNIHTNQKVSGMMKDLNQTAALGSAFETILNERDRASNASENER